MFDEKIRTEMKRILCLHSRPQEQLVKLMTLSIKLQVEQLQLSRQSHAQLQNVYLELYNIRAGRDPNGMYVMGSNFKTNVKKSKTNVKKSKTNVKKSKSMQCWCGKKCNVHVPDAEI